MEIGPMSSKYQAETGVRSPYAKGGEAPLPSPILLQPRAPRRNSADRQARKFRGAFSPDQVRHNFIIESLSKPSWYMSRPYLYTCARCKWAFRVNDSPGSIVPLDQNGETLPEPARSRRIDTFMRGPCGVFPDFTLAREKEPRRPGWIRRTLADVFVRHS